MNIVEARGGMSAYSSNGTALCKRSPNLQEVGERIRNSEDLAGLAYSHGLLGLQLIAARVAFFLVERQRIIQ